MIIEENRASKTTGIIIGAVLGVLSILCASTLCVIFSMAGSITGNLHIHSFFYTNTPGTSFSSFPTQIPSSVPTSSEIMIPEPLTWDYTLVDDFSSNANGWPELDTKQSYGTETMVVYNSELRWVLNTYAGEGHHWQEIPSQLPIVTDFNLAIDLFSVTGSPGADEAGLVFREMDGIGQYAFLINDVDQKYLVAVYENGHRTDLILPTHSDRIKPGDTNRLEVYARGSRFTFSINGIPVGIVVDDTYPSGHIGVGANQHYNGVWGTFHFYHLIFNAKK